MKPGNQLAPGKLSTPPCTVTQASTNGTVVLACSATDFSQPQVDLDALKTQLTGRNPGSATKIIEGRVPEGAERARLDVAVPALLPAALRIANRDRRELRRAIDAVSDVAVTAAGEGTGRTRVLGIDVGSVRIGLAVSDETCTLASPLATVPNDPRTLWPRIAREMEDRQVERVVIGLPRRLDGSEGEAAEQARRFAAELAATDGDGDRVLGRAIHDRGMRSVR